MLSLAVGECQGGRIGAGACHKTQYAVVVHLVTLAGYESHNEYGYYGDEQSAQHIYESVTRCNRLKETGTRLDAYTCQEQCDSHFTQHHIGTCLGICNQSQLITEPAYQDCDDKRTAGQAKLHRRRNTRNRERNAAKEYTHHNTDEYGSYVRSIKAFYLIAHTLCHSRHTALLAHYRKAVTHLQDKACRGKQLSTGTYHAGYGDIVYAAQMKFTQCLAVELLLGHGYAT